MIVMGSAIGIPFAYAVKEFASFDDQMKMLQAVTGGTASELKTLEAEIKRVGAAATSTTAEVAEAAKILGKAGFKRSQIENSLQSITDLAEGTETPIAEAADRAAKLMGAFGIQSGDKAAVMQFFDQLVYTTNNSAQSLEDLYENLKNFAPSAKGVGVATEEILAMSAALSNAGLTGTLAGTQIRRMFINLADPAKAEILTEMGIKVKDVNGELRPVVDLFGDLQSKLTSMNMGSVDQLAKLGEIFGVRAGTGSKVLLESLKGLKKVSLAAFADDLRYVQDEANKTAEVARSSLGNQLKILWANISAVAVEIGQALVPSIKKLVSFVQYLKEPMIAWVKNNEKLIARVGKLAGFLVAAGAALIGISSSFYVAATALGAVTSAVMGALAPFRLLSKTIGKGLGKQILYIGTLFKATSLDVVGSVNVMTTAVKKWVMSFDSAKGIATIVSKTSEILKRAEDGVKTFTNQSKMLSYFTSELKRSLVGVVRPSTKIAAWFTTLEGVAEGLARTFDEFTYKLPSKALGFLENQLFKVRFAFAGFTDAVKAGKYGTFKSFLESTSKRLGSVKAAFFSAGSSVRNFASSFLTLTPSKFFSSVASGLQSMDSSVQSAFERAADSATKFAGSAKTQILKFGSSARKALQNLSSKNPFDALAKGFTSLKEAGGRAAVSFREGFKKRMTGENFSKTFKSLKGGLSSVGGSVVSVGKTVGNFSWKSFLFGFDSSVVAMGRFKNGLITVFRAVSSLARGVASLGVAFIYWEVIEGVVMTIVNTMRSLWKSVSGMLGPFKDLGTAMGAAFAAGDWDGLKSVIFTTIDVIKMTFMNFIDDTTTRIMNWYTDVKGIFMIFWEPLVTTFNGVWGGLKSILNSMWAFFKDTFRNIGEYIDSVFGWNPFEAFFGDAVEGANDFFSSFAGILTAITQRIKKVGIALVSLAKKASITAQFGWQKFDKYSAAAQLRKEVDEGSAVMGSKAGRNFVRRREMSADIARASWDEESGVRSFESDESKDLLKKFAEDVMGISLNKEEFEKEAKDRGGYMEFWDELLAKMDKGINLDLQEDSKALVGQYKATYLRGQEDKKAALAYKRVDDETFQKMEKWEGEKREKNTRREEADKRIADREEEAQLMATATNDRLKATEDWNKQQEKQKQDSDNLEAIYKMFTVGFGKAYTEANRKAAVDAKEKEEKDPLLNSISKIGGFNAAALMAQTRGATPIKAIDVQKTIAATATKQLDVLTKINDHFGGIARGLGLL